MVGHLRGVGLRHDLDAQLPLREVAGLDRVEEIALMAFPVGADEFGGLGVREVLDALLDTVWNFTQNRSPRH